MKKNLSLLKKSSARVAAVQCLYQVVVMDEPIPNAERLIAQFTDRQIDTLRDGDDELKLETDPDLKYFRELVEGVCDNYAGLDENLKSFLNESWTKERMSPLLVSILLVALYELKHRETPPTRVIIDEYVTLAGGFFEPDEQGFINAVLEKAGIQLRPHA